MAIKHIAFLLIVSASAANAADFVRLTPERGMERTELRHLALNGAGDYVAVSHSRVFAGNVNDRTFQALYEAQNSSFVLEASATLNPSGTDTRTVRADIQFLGSRLALNASGDFVLASNTRLFLGNARTGAIAEIANAGSFTRFQQVTINEAGHYVAMTEDKLFAGKVGGEVRALIDDAVGSFEIFDLYAFSDNIDAEVGEQRLALNGAGQFIAATRSAVYGGSAEAMTVEKLFEERGIGFQHVAIQSDGAFVAATGRHVYGGKL